MGKQSGEKSENSQTEVIASLLETLREQHQITEHDLHRYLVQNKKKKAIRVPVSVFRSQLSPLQAFVKFLVEEERYSYAQIANLLGRDQRTIWNTYHTACIKKKERLEIEQSKYFVDLRIFSDRHLSFLEHLCMYLRERYSLRYRDIAALLGKDDRTIWTVCRRATLKNG